MPELSQIDQEKVNAYLSSNVNDVERKPFRPFLLLGGLMVALAVVSLIAYIASLAHA